MTGGASGDRVHHRARPGGVAAQSGCWPGPASHSGPAAYPGSFLLENPTKSLFLCGTKIKQGLFSLKYLSEVASTGQKEQGA